MAKHAAPASATERFHGIGGAFFPEQQPPGTWAEHVALMREAGLRFVRMGEFAWSRLEPREGMFDFAWLDEVMGLLAEAEIRVLLCTPTAVPPLWACETYPDILPVKEDGRTFGFGLRRYTCPTSPSYRDLCGRIAAELGSRYGKSDQVLGWQIDNEFGHPFCFCGRCLERFRTWCETRFGTIDRLNDQLCTHFLGQTVSAFSQVPFPVTYPHPGLWLTYQRFFSDQTIECFAGQASALRDSGVGQPVTTNYMPTWYGYDHEAMSAHLDVVAGDEYGLTDRRLFGDAFEHAMFTEAWLRGIGHGAPIWFHESQWGRADGTLPLPGEVRWNALTQFGRGANLIDFFRVDTCASGAERDGFGLVGVHRKPGRIHAEVTRLVSEVATLTPRLDGSIPVASEVAVLYTFENHAEFARHPKHASFGGPSGNGYSLHLSRHFRALVRQNMPCEIVYPGDDFSRYKVIVAPGAYIMPRALAGKLAAFVADGGSLVMTSLSAVADEHASVWATPVPANLSDVFGIEVRDYGGSYKRAGAVGLRPTSDLLDFPCVASVQWIDEVLPVLADVEVLARFDNPFYPDVPAITRRRHGKGWAVYVGTILDQDGYDGLYTALAGLLALTPIRRLPVGLYATVRRKGDRDLLFLNNPGIEARTCELGEPLTDALTGEPVDGAITLAPLDVRVFVSFHHRL